MWPCLDVLVVESPIRNLSHEWVISDHSARDFAIVEVIGGWGHNFGGGDCSRLFLMPRSVQDWLPADHLALFAVGVVELPRLGMTNARVV
jgi:hypothetical protein